MSSQKTGSTELAHPPHQTGWLRDWGFSWPATLHSVRNRPTRTCGLSKPPLPADDSTAMEEKTTPNDTTTKHTITESLPVWAHHKLLFHPDDTGEQNPSDKFTTEEVTRTGEIVHGHEPVYTCHCGKTFDSARSAETHLLDMRKAEDEKVPSVD